MIVSCLTSVLFPYRYIHLSGTLPGLGIEATAAAAAAAVLSVDPLT